MALGAPLAERELRAAVRAGADEARVRPTGAQRRRAALVGDDLPPPHRVPGRGYGGRAEQVLLHPLLVLHPLLDGDADGIGHRHPLVRSQTHHAVGRDAPQLAVHFAQRDSGPQGERAEPPDGLDVRHQGRARLAERDEYFEWLAFVVFRDRSEEHTSELQSLAYLVCRLLLEKKKIDT